MTDPADLLFERQGKLGLITLYRPDALNALTRNMCLAITEQLRQWTDDLEVKAVVIMGADDRAFCSGGDIRALYESGRAGSSYVMDFYRDEYRLNTLIKEFPKPFIAIIDGITMGGGVGVSIHGSHRIAGDRTLFAMPETGIGLFPDVGGTYFLPRLAGELGMYLGLTGARVKAADAVHAQIATHYVPSGQHISLVQSLSDSSDIEATLTAAAQLPGDSALAVIQSQIDRLFSGESVEAIVANLGNEDTRWAQTELDGLRTKSPTALKITHRQLREGRSLSFREAMQLEFRLTSRVMKGHDFFEGVRAAVIDKDQKPKWQPSRLEDISSQDIDKYFEPLGDDDLEFDF